MQQCQQTNNIKIKTEILTSVGIYNVRLSALVIRPHIAYAHNEPCATLARHFCDDLGRFALKDNKGQQGTTHFVTICDVLYCSTILYSAPFHFCNLF